jgi:putative hydrolase of the HAD superfamily
VDAVFLDALGTLVELEPPWEHLRAAAPDVPQDRLVMAVRAEMAYYRDHAHEGRDEASLADLRERSAAVLSRELGTAVTAAELVAAIRMRAYPDSAPALEELRSRGLKLVVVSNWDCSLGEVLDRCGLGELLDGAVSSAEAGFRKPDPRIFGPALEIAATAPSRALHVGDTAEEDLAGAEAAGIRALLIDREGGARTEGVAASLLEIVDYLGS